VRARRFHVDLGVLRRSGDFRRLLSAQTVSGAGSAVTMVAAPLQVKELTGSFLLVGLLAAVEALPVLLIGLWGGALADSADRRRVVVIGESLLLLTSAGLAVNAFLARPSVAVVFVAAAAAAGVGAAQRPSMAALLPRLVRDEDLAAAAGVSGIAGTATEIGALAIGGVVAAWALPAAYVLDVASFVASAILLAGLRPVPPLTAGARSDRRAIGAGLRYIAGRRDLLGSYAIDIAAMLLAVPDAVFPFLADEVHAPRALGLLYASIGVGGAVAASTSGWTARLRRPGRVVIVAGLAWSAAMLLAGASGELWLILLGLALAGAADMISSIARSLLWNLTVPDHLRGRLAGAELIGREIGPTAGNARAGFAAGLGGARFAIWSGGLLCLVAVAAIGSALPALRRVRINPAADSEKPGPDRA
jgi:MFS family permease